MNSKMHSFDTMPIHPPPEKLEPLTGYFTYLGEVNDIRTVNDLSSMLFPEQNPETVKLMSDCPLLSYGLLSATGLYAEQTLQSMTFHYLCEKFCCPLHPKSAGKFLVS